MTGRYWRGLRRWLHNQFGEHASAYMKDYGWVCPKCYLPVRLVDGRYELSPWRIRRGTQDLPGGAR